MFNRNEEIKRFHKLGYSALRLASFFDISAERVSQILNNDNKDLKNKKSRTLTPREIEILQLIAEGYTDKEMSQKLHISVRTIQTHVGRILWKLKAQNRTNAACMSVVTGVIKIDKTGSRIQENY